MAKLLLVSAAFLQATSALALERFGADFPGKAEVAGHRLVLNGVGLRTKTVFNVKVYAAGLYLAAPQQQGDRVIASQSPMRIELVFLRDVTADQVNTSWDEGFEKNCQDTCAPFADRIKTLKSLSKDIPKGARVAFDILPDKLVVHMDKETAAPIPGGDFSHLVLSNFVGNPPSEEVKEGMLTPIAAAEVTP